MENIMVKGRLLGMGNFAHVHLAYCRPLGGQFAVKSVNSSLSSSLLMEETILRRLRCSPDVVYCFGGYSTQEANGDSAYNLVLEYAAGGSLGRLMFSRTTGSPESEGLHAVHREGFVHCDLKLSNMLLFPTEDGRWRLRSENEAPLDIWCLGCMVIEMFTGKPTWENCKDENDLILHIVFWRQVPLIPENISEEAKDFLKKFYQPILGDVLTLDQGERGYGDRYFFHIYRKEIWIQAIVVPMNARREELIKVF
ncbi:hypothetical protein AAG906_016201 [Vitis piasezkii]